MQLKSLKKERKYRWNFINERKCKWKFKTERKSKKGKN